MGNGGTDTGQEFFGENEDQRMERLRRERRLQYYLEYREGLEGVCGLAEEAHQRAIQAFRPGWTPDKLEAYLGVDWSMQIHRAQVESGNPFPIRPANPSSETPEPAPADRLPAGQPAPAPDEAPQVDPPSNAHPATPDQSGHGARDLRADLLGSLPASSKADVEWALSSLEHDDMREVPSDCPSRVAWQLLRVMRSDPDAKVKIMTDYAKSRIAASAKAGQRADGQELVDLLGQLEVWEVQNAAECAA